MTPVLKQVLPGASSCLVCSVTAMLQVWLHLSTLFIMMADGVSGCALTLSTSPGICPAAPAAVSPVFSSGAALIRHVMDLTSQQVEALPADQKALIIALQTRLVSSPSGLAMLLCCCSQAQQDSPFWRIDAESKPKHAGMMRSTILYGTSLPTMWLADSI